jgi:site-specific DNA recombinase
MTMTVAAYCRISDDRTGEGLGVERQKADCLALASSRGWQVGSVYVDNDVSAYSGKARPQYAALLDAVRSGRVGGIVAWHPDRLHRSPKELEEFITLVETNKVIVETVQAGQWDLSTSSGRLVARQLGSVARYESEHKSERVRRALEQRAAMGRPHGRTAYGWTATGSVKKSEADVVRKLAARIIAGESLRSIVADLNDKGVSSPSGKPWTKTMLKHIVTRERNAGLLIRHGVVVGEGNWKPILDRGTWEQVRAVLNDPARKTSTSSAAKHLLSGLARCGVCGGPMRASLNRTVPSYRCAEKACVSRNRRDVEDLVVGVVLGRLARPDAADLLNPKRTDAARSAAEELSTLQARLDVAADDYADGKIDARQLERITQRLRPKIDAATTQARTLDDSPLLEGLVGVKDVRKRWDSLPLTRQRAVMDLLMSVRVMRAAQGARIFDPETIEIVWKTS